MVLFAVVSLILIWTTPNRWGLGIALHYLSRLYGADPDDRLPDPAVTRDHGE